MGKRLARFIRSYYSICFPHAPSALCRSAVRGVSSLGALSRKVHLVQLLPEVLAVCFCIAMIWGFASLLVRQERVNSEQEAIQRTGNLARAFEESTRRTISEIDQTLLSVRGFWSVQGARFDMAAWARSQSRLDPMTAGVHLIDRDGLLFASTVLPMPATRMSLADRPHFRAQLLSKGDELYISRPVRGRQTGKQTIQFTRKLLGPNGEFAGVAVFSLDSNELSRFYETLQIGGGFVALLNSDGTILARGPLVPNAIGASAADQPYFGAIRSAVSGALWVMCRWGGEQIVSFRRLDDFSLVVLVGNDQDSVFRHFRAVRRNAFILAAGGSVLAVLVGVFWIRLRLRSLATKRALMATLANISQGIIMINEAGNVPVLNRRAVDLLGLPERVLMPGRCGANFSVAGMAGLGFRFPFIGAKGDHSEGDADRPPPSFDSVRGDGSVIEVHSHALPAGGMVQTFTDVTEQRRAGERMRYIAHHDSVTGLPNRVLLNEQLEKMIGRSGVGRMTAVIMIDLDGFKGVNDTMGHQIGDRLLQVVGDRLRALVRRGDVVARLGGDEFVILQPDLTQAQMSEALAQRLITHLGEPIGIAGQQIRIGASVGVAVHPLDGTDVDTLHRCADIALYRAKAAGRGTFRRFDESMVHSVQERRATETDLRRAVAAGELALYFQPQFSSETLGVTGFEALLRWNHPDRGVVEPASFIAIAEACGLIGRIGSWVLECACAEAASWGVPCRVAVNVSPMQLKDAGFCDFVASVLARSGLPADLLEIEVTEGVLIDDDRAMVGVLRELKASGVRITLDDFGTGYSSLSYLLRLPFDKLKIDKVFVQRQPTDPGIRAVLDAVLMMSRRLGLDVVAEGVETEQQLAVVRAQRCDDIQGYLLARPMPAHAVAAYLRDIVTRQPSVQPSSISYAAPPIEPGWRESASRAGIPEPVCRGER